MFFNILLHFSTILSYTVLHLLYTVRHLNLQRICNDDKLDDVVRYHSEAKAKFHVARTVNRFLKCE